MSGGAPTTPPAGSEGMVLRCRMELDCLVAQVGGSIESLEGVIELYRQISVQVRAHGPDSLLVVYAAAGIHLDAEGFQALALAMKHEGFDGLRIAFVDARGWRKDHIEVAEIVVNTHGYRMRSFDDERMARIWLEYGDD